MCVPFWLSHTFRPKGKGEQASKQRSERTVSVNKGGHCNQFQVHLSLIYLHTQNRSHVHWTHMTHTIYIPDASAVLMLEPLVLAVLWRSPGNHARASWETYSGSASLKWHSITSKADVVSFGFPKINFAWALLQFAPRRSSPQFLCVHMLATENKLRRRRLQLPSSFLWNGIHQS